MYVCVYVYVCMYVCNYVIMYVCMYTRLRRSSNANEPILDVLAWEHR